MVEKTTYSMKFRRRREGKTDYHKRLALVKSGKVRLVIRVKNKSVIAQIIKYNTSGDQVLVSATSRDIKKYGFAGHGGNAEAAYLTGLLCGKKALKSGVDGAVLDIGLHTPVNGSDVFAALKGAVDAGMDIPHDAKCFPPEERIITEKGKGALDKIVKEFD